MAAADEPDLLITIDEAVVDTITHHDYAIQFDLVLQNPTTHLSCAARNSGRTTDPRHAHAR